MCACVGNDNLMKVYIVKSDKIDEAKKYIINKFKLNRKSRN